MAAKNKAGKNKAKTSSDSAGQSRNIAENRKARHKYEILEKIECGIVLYGSEVKSLRNAGSISLDESYVRFIESELWLVDANIAEYRQATIWNHATKRNRKLLVHRAQRDKLAVRAHEKGLTLVPLKIYFNSRGIVKVMVGVGRGKQAHDKRHALRDADAKRQLAREMRRR